MIRTIEASKIPKNTFLWKTKFSTYKITIFSQSLKNLETTKKSNSGKIHCLKASEFAELKWCVKKKIFFSPSALSWRFFLSEFHAKWPLIFTRQFTVITTIHHPLMLWPPFAVASIKAAFMTFFGFCSIVLLHPTQCHSSIHIDGSYNKS